MSHQGCMCCCGNHTQMHWLAAASASLTMTTVSARYLFSRPRFSAAWTLCVCVPIVGRRISQNCTGTILVIGTNPLPASVHSVSDQEWVTPKLPCTLTSIHASILPWFTSSHPADPQSTPSHLTDELDKLLLLRVWFHFPWSASGSCVWVQDESAFSNTVGWTYFSYKWNCCLC